MFEEIDLGLSITIICIAIVLGIIIGVLIHVLKNKKTLKPIRELLETSSVANDEVTGSFCITMLREMKAEYPNAEIGIIAYPINEYMRILQYDITDPDVDLNYYLVLSVCSANRDVLSTRLINFSKIGSSLLEKLKADNNLIVVDLIENTEER